MKVHINRGDLLCLLYNTLLLLLVLYLSFMWEYTRKITKPGGLFTPATRFGVRNNMVIMVSWVIF